MAKKEITNSSLIPQGVKPPAAPEIEAAVLGAMLIEKEAVYKAFEYINENSFYNKAHQLIFSSMLDLFNSSTAIDIMTVYDSLQGKGLAEATGGAVYLSKLSQDISSAANIEYHCKILVEKQIYRELISTSHEIATAAYQADDDAFDILDAAESKIFKITEGHLKKSFISMDSAVKDALKYIEEIHAHDHKNHSVPTGYYELDSLLGGFQNSDLVIVAARPSMGKTAFALALARNAAVDNKIPVGVFSLEMATLQLSIRLLCSEAKIDQNLIRTGKLGQEDAGRLVKHAHKLAESPLYIDDAPAQSILEIRAKARRLKAEKKIQMIIIDYLQLIQGPGRMESREREVSYISRSLKALAKELNIPIIALSQLNRMTEQRKDNKPQLSNLRESGSIEQDADVVMFLHRPEYYGIEEDTSGSSVEGVTEVIVAKQRNGPVDTVTLQFIKEYGRFENHHKQIENNVSTTKMVEF